MFGLRSAIGFSAVSAESGTPNASSPEPISERRYRVLAVLAGVALGGLVLLGISLYRLWVS